MEIKAQKGTKDVLPKESYKWHYVENVFKAIAQSYGLLEYRTPTFEATELFTRSVGEETDVVQKEMYTFLDKGKRSITLKPEGTAPVVRSFIETKLYSESQPTKLYYITPCFRYENTQHGRLREFHQFGCEIFGGIKPSIDVEIINIAVDVFKRLGIDGVKLYINSIGCEKCRGKYNEALMDFLNKNIENLCYTCKDRFVSNPMRILDCKEEKCQNIVKHAPVILDYICDDCKTHFEELKETLKFLEISYEINDRIVRGLDYYTKTVFEFVKNGLTICGGGRYDNLISELGGIDCPAVGFGMGIERIIMTLEQDKIEIPKDYNLDLFILSMDKDTNLYAQKMAQSLRLYGFKCDTNHMDRSVKNQMKYANKIGARFIIVIGSDELEKKVVKLKNMQDGENLEVDISKSYDGIIDKMKK